MTGQGVGNCVELWQPTTSGQRMFKRKPALARGVRLLAVLVMATTLGIQCREQDGWLTIREKDGKTITKTKAQFLTLFYI